MIDALKEYIDKRIDLVKLQVTEKGAILSGVIYYLVIALVFTVFFLSFLIIGVGIWIGELLGNYAYGFLVMSGVCLLLLILVLLLRKSMRNFAANIFIKLLNK